MQIPSAGRFSARDRPFGTSRRSPRMCSSTEHFRTKDNFKTSFDLNLRRSVSQVASSCAFCHRDTRDFFPSLVCRRKFTRNYRATKLCIIHIHISGKNISLVTHRVRNLFKSSLGRSSRVLVVKNLRRKFECRASLYRVARYGF